MKTDSLVTFSQFEAMAGELGPCELVRGRVMEMSPGGLRHNWVVGNVFSILKAWETQTGLGMTFPNETGIVTEQEPDTVRGADVVYFSRERLPGKLPSGFAVTPPSLIVEVVGVNRTVSCLEPKAAEYLRMGVDRVWIVDPDPRKVTVLSPHGAPVVLAEADTVSDPEILPGFACRVAKFFEGA